MLNFRTTGTGTDASRLERLTGAEVVAASIVSMLAATVVAAYLLDRLGLAFSPPRLLLLSIGATVAITWVQPRSARGPGQRAELAIFSAIVLLLLAWLTWLAWPTLLPLGSGSDLTHHLQLIAFIEKRWTLVHDTSIEWWIGEMMHYTPGSQLLAALGGWMSGREGVRAVHTLLAGTVALKAGFVFLVARRLLPPQPGRLAFAAISVIFLLVPYRYFVGSFIHDSFYAQVVAELFVVAMWWMLTAWDDSPSLAIMALFALTGTAVFLTWPVLIGAPMVTLAVVVVARRDFSLGARARHLALAAVPIVIIAILYSTGRLGWMQIVRTGGSVLKPSVQEYGGVFLALSVAGIAAAAFRRGGRATVVFVAAIALETLALFLVARTRGPETPYMALKMFFLLIYPQAAAAALTVALVTRAAGRRGALASVLLVAVLAGQSLASAAAPKPAISQPVYLAGIWARDHVTPSCVEYLVGDYFTAYWLHLAVLGNPRVSARTADNSTFNHTDAVIRWLTPGGLAYAIADLSTLSSDVRSDLDIVAPFGSAAVVRRRGPSVCPEAR